jgi:hypothetical protein
MKVLLEAFSDYYIEYDAKWKILYIKAPIPVKDFMRLRKLLENVQEKVVEIRLEAKGKYYY